MKRLASVALVNVIAALAFASVAHTEPTPSGAVGKQFVTTESRAVTCVITVGSVQCSGRFAKQPVGCSETQFCDPDVSEQPFHAVAVEAAAVEGLQWDDSSVQPHGSTALALAYGQVLHLQGWTVEPSSTGTRFTHDRTGRGMFVSRDGVDYRPATPAGQSDAAPCSSATAEVLKSATEHLWGYRPDPFTVARVKCSGDWAMTRLHFRPMDANPPGIVLFHHDDGSWRAVQYGSGFNCTNEGVPTSIAADLEC